MPGIKSRVLFGQELVEFSYQLVELFGILFHGDLFAQYAPAFFVRTLHSAVIVKQKSLIRVFDTGQCCVEGLCSNAPISANPECIQSAHDF